MWEAELAIRHRGCPVSDVCHEYPSIRLENVSRVRVTDGLAKRLLRVETDDASLEAFAEEFQNHESVLDLEQVSNDSSRSAYFVTKIAYLLDNPSILSLIDRSGCFQYSNVVVQHGIEHWVVYTQEKQSLRELVSLLEEQNNNVELMRNVDIGPIDDGHAIRNATLRGELTEKQIAAFQAALELGYYDQENRATVDDVASLLKVHRSTAGEHIKRAETTLLSEVGRHLFPEETARV